MVIEFDKVFESMVKEKLSSREKLPLELQIIRFLSECGYASRHQLIRLFERHFTIDFIEEVISSLHRTGRLGIFIVTPPKHLKIELVRIKAFYLSEKARRSLATIDKDAANFGRFGKPEGENLKRATHELLATESYIWFVKNGYEVLWYMHENQLKKKIGRYRWENIKNSKLGQFSSETTGDYKICVTNKKDWKVETFECEVSIRYKLDHIKRKPKNLKWFCLTEMQSRMIEEVTGEPPIILRGFIEDEQIAAAQELINSVKKINTDVTLVSKDADLQNKIVETLEKMGGGCTGKVLAQSLKISYSQLRNKQTFLLTDSRININKGVVCPGVTRGRSLRIFHLNGIKLNNSNIKLIILHSLVLENFFKTGWEIDYFDTKLRALILQKPEYKIAFRIDDLQETDVSVVQVDALKVNNIIKNCDEQNIKFKYVCINKERLAVLKNHIPSQNLIDFTTNEKLISESERRKMNESKLNNLQPMQIATVKKTTPVFTKKPNLSTPVLPFK